MKRLLSTVSLAVIAAHTAMGSALAQDAIRQEAERTGQTEDKASEASVGNDGVFQLGKIIIYGGVPDTTSEIGGQSISQSTISSEEIRKTNRNTLDDAVATTPGVTASNSGGSRNERLIFVRGFDRFQVPLYIDGVRIYLPADNRLDYGRFLTPDLSEIQIQKGYVSVLSGPGAMGGAINLVSRKPTKEFEAELRTGFELGNTGDLSAFTTSGWVGTKQENFYLQASGSFRDSDGWYLPRGYNPVPVFNNGSPPVGVPVEDGGRRDFSEVQDWRLNFKAGYTPNDTDEYVVSYTKQAGNKGAPYSIYEPVRGITPTPVTPNSRWQRDWTWPVWNTSSLSFNSNTAIGDESYIKSKVFYNTFDNLLSAYNDSTFQQQTNSNTFDSYYDDHAFGFGLEGGTELIERNTLKAAVHFRRDVHKERNDNAPDVPMGTSPRLLEPWQKSVQDTWSLAGENTFHATEKLDLVGGLSYESSAIGSAEEYDKDNSSIYNYPTGSSSAVNWQLAAIYRQSEMSEFHASVSSRTRFPSLFELYSTRFGSSIPNPDLKQERAVNYEIGWSGRPMEALGLGGALFYSDITNVIQRVPLGGVAQNQNVGDGQHYGFEGFAEWDVRADLTLGANYTYLHRKLVDPVRADLKPLGTPEHSLYVYANWMPLENFTVSPNLEVYSSRWSADRNEENFFETGGFALVNLNMNYAFSERFELDFGARNIFDTEYQLSWGFPEAGRSFYLNTSLRF